MSINALGSETQVNRRNNISSALKTGIAATGLQYALFPSTAKASIKNTILGEDIYLKRSSNAILKTVKNLDKAGKDNIAGKINVREAMENAKAMFPKYQRVAKPALAALGRTFAGVAVGVFIGHIIADKMFENKEQ